MEGKIFDFNPETGSGLIRTADGNRYEFISAEFKSQGDPTAGMKVDFDINGKTARTIYNIGTTDGSPLFGSIKNSFSALPGLIKKLANVKTKSPRLKPGLILGDNDETVIWHDPPNIETISRGVGGQNLIGVVIAFVALLSLFLPFVNFAGVIANDTLLFDSPSLIDGNLGKTLLVLSLVIGLCYLLDFNRSVIRISALFFVLLLMFHCYEIYMVLYYDHILSLVQASEEKELASAIADRLEIGFYLIATTAFLMFVFAFMLGQKAAGNK